MNLNVFGLQISISRGKSLPATVIVPDFMQEAKQFSLMTVKEGNPKDVFLRTRFSHATGACREFIRQNPHMRADRLVLAQIEAMANLGGQLEVFPTSKVSPYVDR